MTSNCVPSEHKVIMADNVMYHYKFIVHVQFTYGHISYMSGALRLAPLSCYLWSLTLGAHAQEQLQYSLCVCVCVCVCV